MPSDKPGLAKFIRENILSGDVEWVEIPSNWGEAKTEKTLFGWRLWLSGGVLGFETEQEARYFGIMAEMGLTRVPVPKDRASLSSVVGRLEEAYAGARHIVARYSRGLLRKSDREKLERAVWDKVRQNAGLVSSE